jgi:hypothetical protein
MKYPPYDPSDIHELDRLASLSEYQYALDNFKSKYRHKQVLKATLLGHEAKLDFKKIHPEIRKALIEKGGRDEQPNEILNAWNGITLGGGKIRSKEPTPKWASHDQAEAEKLLKDYESEVGSVLYDHPSDFFEECPLLKSNKIDQFTGNIIREVMPEDPLLCVGTSPYQFQTDSIGNLNPLNLYPLIVPNPCSKKLGKKSSVAHLPDKEVPDDMWSAHTKDNTGERIHLVIEFDDSDKAHQCRSITFLRKFLPLVMVVYSAHKSLHAWYKVEGYDPDYVRDFFNLACVLGADKTLWGKHQFVRMPNAYRDDDKAKGLQRCYFYKSPRFQKTCPLTEGVNYEMPIVG